MGWTRSPSTEQKINAAKLPQEVDAKLRKELTRLSKQPYGSAEASVLRNYLDVCLELPWSRCAPKSGSTWRRPERYWTLTTTAWTR